MGIECSCMIKGVHRKITTESRERTTFAGAALCVCVCVAQIIMVLNEIEAQCSTNINFPFYSPLANEKIASIVDTGSITNFM